MTEKSQPSEQLPHIELEQTLEQVLQDGRISKEELHKLSDKYKDLKDKVTKDIHPKIDSLMRESIMGMLKEYTINDATDKSKLESLVTSMNLGYTFDKSITDTSTFPIKVKLDGTVIRPVGIMEGVFTTENEHNMDMKSLLELRKPGHIRAALANGFYPISKDKKEKVTNFIEDKFADMNAAIDGHSGSNENALRRNAERAYSDIIYCVMNGGNMDRPSGAGEKIRFRMNGNDIEKAKEYLMQLINKDIPNTTRITLETPVENPVKKLLEATQGALNSYARKNGYSSIDLKSTDIFAKDISLSQVQEYQLIINKDLILSNGQTNPGKPFIINGITLQKSHLGPLKSEYELYNELIKRIEDLYPQKPLASHTQDPIDRPAQGSVITPRANTERNTESYNQRFFKAHKGQFEAVQTKIKESKDSKVKGLMPFIDVYMKDQSGINAFKIQTELNSKFGAKLNPDKDFGPITLGVLEKAVSVSPAGGTEIPPPSRTNQPPELIRRPSNAPVSASSQPSQVVQPPESVSEKANLPTSIVFRDGAYYMIGKNGKPQKVEYTQYSESPALKANIEAQKARLPLVTDVSIFLEAFAAENPKEAQKVEKAWKMAQEFLQNGSTDSQKVTNQIVVETLGAHWGSAKWYNMFAIKDDGQRRIELYKLIKEDMGQYDLVVQHISRTYTRKLSPDTVKEMISSFEQGKNYNNYISQKSADAIAKEMTEMKSAYQKAWNENKQSYIAAYKQEFKITTDLTSEQLSKAESNFLAKGMDQAFRIALLKNTLNNEVNWKGDHKDPTMDLASSILGTGTFNMSSRMARESAKMLAIEAIALAAGAVTMGAGTLAIHALSATRFARLATLGTEAGSIARLGVATLGNGVAFELGHGGAKSLIEGENMYSQRGFVDSILFTGVLGGVNRFLSGTNKLAQWSQVGSKGVQFAKGVLIEGTALNVAGVTSKIAFQDNIVWSPEEIAQAFLMSALFRGANASVNAAKNKLNKGTATDTLTTTPTTTVTSTETNTLTATKNSKGEIEVKPSPVNGGEASSNNSALELIRSWNRLNNGNYTFQGTDGKTYTITRVMGNGGPSSMINLRVNGEANSRNYTLAEFKALFERKPGTIVADEVLDSVNSNQSRYQGITSDVTDVSFRELSHSTKYYGSADKLIIARSNQADIRTFQTTGYDLTPYGFDGWRIVQVQNNGIANYSLSHSNYGVHVFNSPKEVQTFLLTGKVEPKIIAQAPSTLSNNPVLVIDVSVKDVLNRTAFNNTKVSPDGLTRINLDTLGLEGVTAVKYKNSGKSELQYKIEGLNPKDNNSYSLSDLQKRIEEIQRSRNIIQN